MRRLRRIKILATLGPASSDSAMIRRLFEAGADVFRINMSHTSHDKMRELVKTIRNVESSYGRPIGILVDLQGPKLRLGSFAARDGGCRPVLGLGCPGGLALALGPIPLSASSGGGGGS